MGNTCINNLYIGNNPTRLTLKILKSVSENKKQIDVDYENITDSEIANLIRQGFSISFNNIFGCCSYIIRW